MRVARQFTGSEAKGTTPTGFDGDVLLALHFIADRRRENASAGGRRPHLRARIGTESAEVAHAIALEHQVARRGQRAAVPRVRVLDAPHLLLRHRVPGLQVALHGALDGGLDGRDLRQAAGVEVHARIPAELALLEIGIRDVREAHIHGRDVDEPRRGVEGHGLPAMRTAGARHIQERLAGFAPASVRVFDGAAGLHVEARGPALRSVRRGRQQFAGGAVQHVEIAILRRLHQHLARLPVDGQVRQHDVLGGGVVPGVARGGLVVPHVLAALRLQRHDGRKIEVVATTGAANLARPRRTVTHTDVNEVELGVVHDGIPHSATTAELPPFTRPGLGRSLQGRAFRAIRRVRRHGIEAPQLLAGSGVVGGDIATHTQLGAAVADEHLALRHARGAGDGVAAAFRRSAHAPHFLAGGRVDSHQTTIEGADIQLAFPSRGATIDGVAAGMHTRLPRHLRIVGPQLLAARGIERKQLAPRGGHIHDAIDDERCRFLRAVRSVQVHAPGQAQLADVRVVHLLQR